MGEQAFELAEAFADFDAVEGGEVIEGEGEEGFHGGVGGVGGGVELGFVLVYVEVERVATGVNRAVGWVTGCLEFLARFENFVVTISSGLNPRGNLHAYTHVIDPIVTASTIYQQELFRRE